MINQYMLEMIFFNIFFKFIYIFKGLHGKTIYLLIYIDWLFISLKISFLYVCTFLNKTISYFVKMIDHNIVLFSQRKISI